MNRTAALAFVSLALFLLIFPLTLAKPGVPPSLKADEPAYFMMAQSLAFDRDLELRTPDIERVYREFPFRQVSNLIVESDDGWRTVYYGKPYIYSLLAAPFVRLAGADGMLACNMLLFLAMVWMGWRYLARYNSEGLALLFAAGFFFLSTAFGYVFWLQAEIFNMAAVCACFYLGFDRPAEEGGRKALLLALASGAALALAAYNKPVYAALALPLVVAWARQRRWARAATWIGGAALAGLLCIGGAWLLTGHFSAYLGVARQGVVLCEPDRMPIGPSPAAPAASAPSPAGDEDAPPPASAAAPAKPALNAWSWIFARPEVSPREFLENAGYFLWGRHTGLLLYLPFALVATLLFLAHARRSLDRWLLLVALGGVAFFFLFFIFFNWHGGGGFLGNRYFVSVYPAFLFLVTRIAPRWSVPAGFAYAGLFLGTIVLAPLGLGAPEPTLQAHARNWPYRFFPLELTLRNVPGYQRLALGSVRILGSQEVMLPQGEAAWLRGASRAELWLLSEKPLRHPSFFVRSEAPQNRVRLDMEGAHADLRFGNAGDGQQVELDPGPGDVLYRLGETFHVYRLIARTESGRVKPWRREAPPNQCPYFPQDKSQLEGFYTGAALTYLGEGDRMRADLYAVDWRSAQVPPQVGAGATFAVPVAVRNASREAWPVDGAARVRLSYHWWRPRAGGGEDLVVEDGARTDLAAEVPPGGVLAIPARVEAPTVAGRYTLEVDLVFEGVAWFGARNGGKTYRAEVEVLPAPAAAGSPAGHS